MAMPVSKGELPRWTPSTLSDSYAGYRKRLVDAQCAFLNTTSTIAIVFLNKIIFRDTQLQKCQILFAMWHFTTTFAVLYVSTLHPFRLFERVRVSFWQMVPICLFFAGFLVLSNLSLTFNPIGFYQLAKIMTTPAVVFFNFVLFGLTISTKKLCAVLASCVGVGLASGGTIRSNPLGAFIATSAFSVTACYQIWIGKKLQDLDVSPPQLLLNQAPVAVLLLTVLVPFLDTIPDLSLVPAKVLWTVFASGIVASLINLSQFLIIGRTSPLTYNIISMVKMIAILSLGWYIEGKVMTLMDDIGVVLALGGAWVYATSKT